MWQCARRQHAELYEKKNENYFVSNGKIDTFTETKWKEYKKQRKK